MTAAALSALCLTLAGCGNKQSVLFVTATTIGIDADTTPPHATIGYDRYEGYIGPSYRTGALPPVVAKIESDLKIFNPEIRQLYATGDAAKLVTKEKLEEGDPKKDGEMYTGSGRLTLFGTGTNIGLRVTWAGNVPESISFGYKRKEFSYIPLGSEPIDPNNPNSEKVDRYGSALAAIDMGVHTESITTTGMAVTQFFATGDAAKNLAVREPIRKRFLLEAEQSVRATTCNYGPDENTDKLDAAAAAQPNFHEKLTAWLAREGIDTDPATFTICDLFADARAKAVQDTALMNQ